MLGLHLSVFGLIQKTSAQTFHLLIFADTDDPGLSAPNLMNISFLTEMANDVCQATGLKNQMMVFKGKDFLASRCDQVLSNFKPEANDVVFFYFMGHGWNNSETEEPMLLFKTQGQSPGPTNSRNLKAVFEQLRRKGNRLTLAFGESCNSAINDRSKAKGHNTRIMNVSAIQAEQLKNLFLQSRASILLHTCKRGQKSNSSEDGGWFFTSFYDQFKQFTSKSFRQQPAEWRALLSASTQSTIEYAREQGAVQEPVFQIFATETVAGSTGAAVATASPVSTGLSRVDSPSASVLEPSVSPVVTEPVSSPESTGDLTGICAINRVAFKALQSHLSYLKNFRGRVSTMEPDAAAEEFRKYYSTDRQEFFRLATQKLNVINLGPEDVAWFTKTCGETAELLDETNDYINDPQFRNIASSKLAIPIDNLGDTVARVQNLLRRCKE
ncbi:hypothetical protein DYU11_08990 [Fibrisoma montanum]|uniref:Peptidase C14 caspase domain-containing protein n=2 Tax=Fibrisoma montanum TaxID=2305895 RepID=A0A418MFA7_9BACT|nr:hypothetical protein DYU11_08990 [Fibrisoma montanum]